MKFVVIYKSRFPRMSVTELQSVGRRTREAGQQPAENPPRNHEPSRRNRVQRGGAIFFVRWKQARQFLVAGVAYTERGDPHLDFFGHQLKRGQLAPPPLCRWR